MRLSPEYDRELWTLCEDQWDKIRKRTWRRNWKPRPNADDWRDIRAVAFARVFQQADVFDPAKGSSRSWVGTVLYRSMLNSLRDRRRWLSDRGVEVQLEPSLVSPRQERDSVEVDEFRALLGPEDGQVLDQVMGGSTLSAVAHQLGFKTCGSAYPVIRRIARRWRSYQRGSRGALVA